MPENEIVARLRRAVERETINLPLKASQTTIDTLTEAADLIETLQAERDAWKRSHDLMSRSRIRWRRAAKRDAKQLAEAREVIKQARERLEYFADGIGYTEIVGGEQWAIEGLSEIDSFLASEGGER